MTMAPRPIFDLPLAFIVALLAGYAAAALAVSPSQHVPAAVQSVRDSSERPAPELWAGLSQSDKDAVTRCVRGSSYVNLVLPDILELLKRGHDSQAIQRAEEYCSISAPAATAIVALTSYVYGVK